MASVATGAGTRKDVTLKIAQLQNLCKRDPAGYREDYDAQVRRLRSECGILSLSPSANPSPRLVELIQFAAAVSSSSYKGEESDAIADLLIGLLLGQSTTEGVLGNNISADNNNKKKINETAETTNMTVPTAALSLHKDVRKASVSALILMRNKGSVPPLRLLELFFRIMAAVPDKSLREHLYRHIVNDVRNINKKGRRDEKVNRSVQSFLHKVVSATVNSKGTGGGNHSNDVTDGDSASDVAAKRAVDMVSELYRRNVWTDERTVAIMASAVQSSNSSVMAKAVRFFLGIEEKMAEDKEREENDEWNGVQEIDFHLHSRKTKARQRQVAKQVKNRKKAQLKREQQEKLLDSTRQEDQGVQASKNLYPAIEMLNDPQGLSEVLFRKLRNAGSNAYKFDHKLLLINFITRLVGNHELLLLPLYPYLQRYMGGHQRDVTSVLSYAVQACHEYVPPQEIYGLLKTIAHNFITERCSGEQMAVGINACRAICARVPSVLAGEDDDPLDVGDGNATGSIAGTSSVAMDIEAFARDLAAYSKHRDRSVSIAGKGWTNFIREVHPSLLAGKDRGTSGSALHRAGEKPLRYGEQRVASGVAGADLLVEYEAKKAAYLKKKEERRARGEESEESDDDDGGDGITMEKMNDVISDDEEDEGWVDVKDGEDDDEDEGDGDDVVDEEIDEGESDKSDNEDEEIVDDEDVAPTLVPVKIVDGKMVPVNNDKEDGEEPKLDLTKMTPGERAKLQQEVSSTRVFSASDFEKMRKLVERQERAKRDPRAAAKLKRLKAEGKDFEVLSDDDEDDSDDEGIRVKGVVNPGEIMAMAKKKRANKIERLEKIIAGRDKFEHKQRDGGSTNTEKKRKKNFLMTKFSFENRKKRGAKETARQEAQNKRSSSRDNKKRRRKF